MAASIQHCTIEKGYEEMKSNGSCQLIDVREPAEFDAERAPQARNIPLSDIDRQADTIDRNKKIFVICESGTRSQQAAQTFWSRGFDNVTILDGGIGAWIKAGYPVEGTGRKTWSIERQVRLGAGLLVLTGALLSWLAHPAWLALSAFVGCGLIFAALTNTCGMAAVLLKMPWNQLPKKEENTKP
jgi:rhodanese-related sulfurtransferase